MLEKAELRFLVGLLEERLRVIGNAEMRENDPAGQLAKLQEVSEKIGAFHNEHCSHIPPRLSHFLKNCSYTKAQDWANEALAVKG